MTYLCDYCGYDAHAHAWGAVFAVTLEQLGPLPPSEMAEVREFDKLPSELTYPFITPVLFAERARQQAQEQ